MKRYSEYKDSGVEWIDTIPKHWLTRRAKYLLSVRKEKSTTGHENLLSVTEHSGVVQRSSIKNVDDGEHLSRSESLIGYAKVSKDDLVSNIMLTWKRALGVSPFDGVVSPAYSVFRFASFVVPKFYHYLLRDDRCVTEFRKRSKGIVDSRLRMYDDSFLDLPLLLPTEDEQNKIALFLDRKTALIDSLIEKKKRKIELLEEQKASLISHVVTKGLYPDAEMKDSEVEWIGDIPRHWTKTKLKHISAIELGKMLDSKRSPKPEAVELPYLRNLNVQDRFIELDDLKKTFFTPSEICNYLLKDGDLLVTEGGDVGRTARWQNEREGMMYQKSLNRVRLTTDNSSYFEYLLSSFYSKNIYLGLVDTTSIPHFTKEKLGRLEVIVPPSNEQDEIEEYLDSETQYLDCEIDKSGKSILLLQEYRRSLISEAVTGKIDVRDWSPSEVN